MSLDVGGASVVIETVPNAMLAFYFPQGNDIAVTVYYPEVADGTGASSKFYYKKSRETSDTDPTTITYTAPIVNNPDSTGTCMSVIDIPAADNAVSGSFWWRIDAIDSTGDVSTVGYGALLVKGV